MSFSFLSFSFFEGGDDDGTTVLEKIIWALLPWAIVVLPPLMGHVQFTRASLSFYCSHLLNIYQIDLGVTNMIFSDGAVLYLNLNCFLRWWSTWSGLKPPQWTTWGLLRLTAFFAQSMRLGFRVHLWGLPWLYWIAFCVNTCLAPENQVTLAMLSCLTSSPGPLPWHHRAGYC